MNAQFQPQSLTVGINAEYDVEFNPPSLSVQLDSAYVEIPEYTGSYYVTPYPYTSYLQTKGKKMTQDITIGASYPTIRTATKTLQSPSREISFAISAPVVPRSWVIRFNGTFTIPTSTSTIYRILEARYTSALRVLILLNSASNKVIYSASNGIIVTEQTYTKLTLESTSASETSAPGFFNPGSYELVYSY